MMHPFRPALTELDPRACPAALSLAGGVATFAGDATGDAVTLSTGGTSYGVSDATALIDLDAAAYAAGWRGSHTHTVAGPRASVSDHFEVYLGDGDDTFNLRQCDVAVYVDGQGGADTINLCSNAPSNTAVLSGILGTVTVVGDGADTLVASDMGANSGNAVVSIDAAGVHGFAGPTDGTDIVTTGAFVAVKVFGSGGTTLAESFTVSGSAGPLTLKANAGDDTIDVTGDTTGVIWAGAGADTITVYAGVTLTGDVHTGGQVGDVVYYGPPAYGVVTGTVGA